MSRVPAKTGQSFNKSDSKHSMYSHAKTLPSKFCYHTNLQQFVADLNMISKYFWKEKLLLRYQQCLLLYSIEILTIIFNLMRYEKYQISFLSFLISFVPIQKVYLREKLTGVIYNSTFMFSEKRLTICYFVIHYLLAMSLFLSSLFLFIYYCNSK